MAKTKVICIIALLLVAGAQSRVWAQEQKTGTHGLLVGWKTVPMDGSRCGASIPSVDNVPAALGLVKDGVYYAPNGKVYNGGATASVAELLIGAQPQMASVKAYVGYCPVQMDTKYPESELSNMIVDCIMNTAQKETGKKVDVGLTNFGGIRCSMPQGNVILDDILSMLPFKNYVIYLEMTGEKLRAFLEDMCSRKVQVLGGVNIEIKDGKMTQCLVGGEPIDDSKTYGFATVDFLLKGGDGVFALDYASQRIDTGVLVFDALYPYLQELTTQGKPIEYKTDGRVRIVK